MSPGFRLTQFDLDCRGGSRQDVRVFYRIFNPTIVALFRKHFWFCPQKLAVADFIEIVNNGMLVLQSRVINDEEFPLKSAYRFHQPEQETALDLFVASVSGLLFYTKGSMTFKPSFNLYKKLVKIFEFLFEIDFRCFQHCQADVGLHIMR